VSEEARRAGWWRRWRWRRRRGTSSSRRSNCWLSGRPGAARRCV